VSETKKLTQDEWLRRYKQRFIERAELTEAQAQQCAEAEPFSVLSEFFEDEPEDAADEEMSCWESDGDEPENR
jgi:hypothetical protein